MSSQAYTDYNCPLTGKTCERDCAWYDVDLELCASLSLVWTMSQIVNELKHLSERLEGMGR